MRLENFIAQKKVSKGLDDKMKLEHRGTRSILVGPYRCQNEVFEVMKWNGLYWRLVLFGVSYCCAITEVKNMSGAMYGTPVDRHCIR